MHIGELWLYAYTYGDFGGRVRSYLVTRPRQSATNDPRGLDFSTHPRLILSWDSVASFSDPVGSGFPPDKLAGGRSRARVRSFARRTPPTSVAPARLSILRPGGQTVALTSTGQDPSIHPVSIVSWDTVASFSDPVGKFHFTFHLRLRARRRSVPNARTYAETRLFDPSEASGSRHNSEKTSPSDRDQNPSKSKF